MHSLRHATVIAALAALLSTGLVSPAQAAVFDDFDFSANNGVTDQSAVACTISDLVDSTPVSNVPVIENGGAATVTQSNSGKITRDSDPTDVIDFASNITSKVRVASSGGNPTTMTMDATGSVKTVASKGLSTCKVAVFAYAQFQANFTVTDPGFFLYDYDASRYNYGEINIRRPDGEEFTVENQQSKWQGAGRVFVGSGLHKIFMETDAWIDQSSKNVPVTPVNVNLHLRYVKAGSALGAAKGKAKPYVKFPKARNCASDDVRLTVKKGKASKVQSIKLLLNGKTVKTIKGPKGGEKANLKVADSSDAVVVARVTLKPAKKGAKPVTVESAGSYIACA